MYAVGSRIVHPAYGAGTIIRIQEKSIGDSTNQYYVIDTVPGPREMRLMVPVDAAGELGLRRVGDKQQLLELLDTVTTPPEDDDVVQDFRRRKALITDQLKSGSFSEVVAAVRMLHYMSTERRLSMTDRSLLDQGKEILASELALAMGVELDQALSEIEGELNEMIPTEE